MRKSCVQAWGMTVHSLSITSWFIRRPYTAGSGHVHKASGYTTLSAQLSSSIYGPYEQLLRHINRVFIGVVHTMHRPYRNYNYVIN